MPLTPAAKYHWRRNERSAGVPPAFTQPERRRPAGIQKTERGHPARINHEKLASLSKSCFGRLPLPDVRHLTEDKSTATSGGAPAVNAKPHQTWIDLAILIILCAAIRLPWLFMTPISQAPDEGAHYWVMHHILTQHSLPLMPDIMANPAAAYYGALAPLSYLPHLLSSFLFGFFDTALALRFGSLFMGMATVALAYLIARELNFKARVFTLGVPMFVAFHPQLAFVNSYSNNDSTVAAVSALTLYSCILSIKRGLTKPVAVLLGVASGLLGACKPTGYCLFAVVAASTAASILLHQNARTAALRFLSISTPIAAVIAAPFLVRNYVNFDGDWTGMNTMLHAWWTAYGKPPQLYPWPVITHADWRYIIWVSYWGAFGNTDKLCPSFIYKGYAFCLWGAAAGWCAALALAVRAKFARGAQVQPTAVAETGSDTQIRVQIRVRTRASAAVWAMLLLAVVCNFVAVVAASASLNSTGPPQGRYMFPAEVAIAALLVGGYSFLPGRLGKLAAAAFISFMFVSCIKVLLMLYPLYGFSTNIFR